MNSKHIFITGSHTSAREKAIISSSLACLLKARGYRVAIQNFDLCLNCDLERREMPISVGISKRIAEVDVEYITLGKIFKNVLNEERRGAFNGARVKQAIHVVDEIKSLILHHSDVDFIISEMQGSVTEDDSWTLLEAMRQICYDIPQDSCCIHVTSNPDAYCTTQSLNLLRTKGIPTNYFVISNENCQFDDDSKAQFARNCNLSPANIVQIPAEASDYENPLILNRIGFDQLVLRHLNVVYSEATLTQWQSFIDKANEANDNKKITIVCVSNEQPTDELIESLKIAAIHAERTLDIVAIPTDKFSHDNAVEFPGDADAIVFADSRYAQGEENYINALKWCRTTDVPTLSIGFGMKCMVKEFARNAMKLIDTDLIEAIQPVNDYVAYKLSAGSRTSKAFGNTETITELCMAPFGINKDYSQRLADAGMSISGHISTNSSSIAAVEISNTQFYIGTIFNPEYSSTALTPNPIFTDFISQAINYHNVKNQNG